MDNNPIKKRIARRQYIYRKRIPYGMMNFVSVRQDDCYYVDKTDFIAQIEDSNKFSSISALVVSARALPSLCLSSITTSIWLIGLRNFWRIVYWRKSDT